MTLYIDEEKVRKAICMEDLIAAMEKALIEFSSGRVTQPPRQFLPVEKYNGLFGIMPAITDESMGVKLLTFYPENAKNNLPTHLAVGYPVFF